MHTKEGGKQLNPFLLLLCLQRGKADKDGVQGAGGIGTKLNVGHTSLYSK